MLRERHDDGRLAVNGDMRDSIEGLPARVIRVEEKLDALAVSFDRRFAQVDERFASVDSRLASVDSRLASFDNRFAEVDRRFADVDRRFGEVDERFAEVDRRFTEVDKRFDEVDKRFDEVSEAIAEQRQYTEFAFDRLHRTMLEQFADMRGYFQRLDHKLDLVVTAGLARSRCARAKKP